jgi:pilus assembly protein CpaC
MKNPALRRLQWGVVGLFGLVNVMLAGAVARAENGTPIQVNVSESVVFASPEVIDKVAIADPSIANFVVLTDKEVSVIGVKAGITTLTIVPKERGPTRLHRVRVVDPVAEEAARKAEAEARAAQQAAEAAVEKKIATIRAMAAQKDLEVRTIGDTLVIDGQVDNELQVQRAISVAGAYNPKVLSLVEVRQPRQIKIHTRVAEVNTEAIRNMGFRWFGPAGEVQYALDYNIPGGSILHGMVQPASSRGTAPTTPNEVDIGVDVILQLLVTKNYARLLSEPTLITTSGKEASFLVGQEVPIVQQLAQSFTVEFKEVGVRMNVKPVADSQNRINTSIQAEVSQVVGVGAFGIPIIGSKKAETTLQVNDGQTIVIGGLLENNLNRDFLRKVPWLADIPIFGFLFRHKEFQQAQREVLFFMTPEIIKDANAATARAAQTPLMQEWHGEKADENILEVPNPRDDWGLHNPDGLGLPERKPREKAEPVEAPAAAAPKPAPRPARAEAPKPAPTVAPAPAPEPKPAPAPKPVKAEPEPEPPAERREPTQNFGPARPAQ